MVQFLKVDHTLDPITLSSYVYCLVLSILFVFNSRLQPSLLLSIVGRRIGTGDIMHTCVEMENICGYFV